MGLLLTDIRTQVSNLVPQIDTELTNLQIDQLTKRAALGYSNDDPDTRNELIAGNGTRYYNLLTVLSGWDDDFSRVTKIEYPAYDVSLDYEPNYIPDDSYNDSYKLYDTGTGTEVTYLYLDGYAPSVSDNLRINYTLVRQWVASAITTAVSQVGHGFSVNDGVYQNSAGVWVSGDVQTLATHIVTVVPDADNLTAAELQFSAPSNKFFALSTLTAAHCCHAIAAYYSRTSDSTITSDAVDHAARAREFSKRYNELMSQYRQLMGMPAEGKPQAGGMFVNLKTRPTNNRRRYLFHNEPTDYNTP